MGRPGIVYLQFIIKAFVEKAGYFSLFISDFLLCPLMCIEGAYYSSDHTPTETPTDHMPAFVFSQGF